MVKVNRKIGAVAVYSPVRAAALVLAVTALLLAAGFALARLTDGEDSRASAPAEPPQAARVESLQSRLDASEARLERVLARLRKVRAQRRSYAQRLSRTRRAGARATADAGAGRLATGRPYIVMLRKGREGADYVIGPRRAMERGMSYRRCPDGRGICVRRDGS